MRSFTSLSTIGLSLAIVAGLVASCGGGDVVPEPTGSTTTTGGGDGGAGGIGGVGGMPTTSVGGGGSSAECGNGIEEEGEE